MGQLGKSHLVEAGIWSLIVAIFFGYTFEFNQPIEIYKFGATGWPRVIILLLLLVTLGNLFHQFRNGSAIQKGRVGIAETDEAPTDYSNPATLAKIMAILFTPFLFAWLLKPVGMYSGAPFFIAAVIWLFGERRWQWILGITLLIYAILLGLFVVTLNAPLPQGNVSPFYDVSGFILKMNTQLQQLW
ncbi:MAG: tripartite tricarboxylate transporter TctB family protein [Rhodobiaceae bacterium]